MTFLEKFDQLVQEEFNGTSTRTNFRRGEVEDVLEYTIKRHDSRPDLKLTIRFNPTIRQVKIYNGEERYLDLEPIWNKIFTKKEE